MNSETLYWWAVNGEQRGPVFADKLRELVRNGTVPMVAMIWAKGWEDWRSVGSVAQMLALPIATRPVETWSPAPSPRKSRLWQSVALLGALVLLSFIWAGFTYGPHWSDYRIATSAVSLKLKSPATAQFCGIRDCVYSKRGSVTSVSGDVDSQNSFGAMVRSTWIVDIDRGKVSFILVAERK